MSRERQGELPLGPGGRGRDDGVLAGVTVLTIGHSNRTAADFVGLLTRHGVELLVDVRAFSRSRRNPQFNMDALPDTLAAAGIGYRHVPRLGGRRPVRADSPNTGWREPGFRGYADHMATADFAAGLAEVVTAAASSRVALMCAEAEPWRCHRSLIADALVVRGVHVAHIMGTASPRPHRLTPFARADGTTLTYPPCLTD